MPLFIKTETFTTRTRALSVQKRKVHLDDHRAWVKSIQNSGGYMVSGYLVDKDGFPGGGGVLVFEAETFQSAKAMILDDPMISRGLVKWALNEWRPICGNLSELFRVSADSRP